MTLLIWAALVTSAHARLYDEVVESGVLYIAVYDDNRPYSYREEGVAKGVDIEVGKAIAARLGVQPEWFWVTADENVEDDLRNAVWKGHMVWKFDSPIKSLADVMLRVPYDFELEARNEMFVLFAPYASDTFLLAYDTNRIEEFRNYTIFGYEPVSVETDSIPDFMLSSIMGGRLRNQVRHFRTQLEANQAVLSGEVAATMGVAGVVEHGLSQAEHIHLTPAPMQMIAMPRKVLRCPNIERDWTSDIVFNFECQESTAAVRTAWDIGVAVRQDFRDLGYAIEGEMMALIDDGTIQRIYESYGMTYRLPQFLQVEE
jgi:hypothetical protein